MNHLKIGVIGCGHLGKIHARLATQLEHATLVGASDPSESAREFIDANVGCPTFDDYRTLAAQIDAAIVAAPTSLHFDIVQALIDQGIHVLVEKPMTTNLIEAERLVAAARSQQVVLAVGHVEQFNPTFAEMRQQIQHPRLIEAVRTGGFTFRSTDVGVVFDLMIHDLDLIRSLAGCPVADISATGFSLLSNHEDFAEARVTFTNGCTALLKASRTSQPAERKLTVHTGPQRIEMDLATRQAHVMSQSAVARHPEWNVHDLTPQQVASYKEQVFEQLLPVESCELPQNNPLQDEQQDFVNSILDKTAPRVSGGDALESIRMAIDVIACIQSDERQSSLPNAA